MDILDHARAAVRQEITGLEALSSALDARFSAALGLLANRDALILSGVGKSGHIARKLAATLMSLGTRATFLHPTDAAHGDMGFVSPDDAILVFSRSGQASELVPLLAYGKHLGVPVVLVSENHVDGLAQMAEVTIQLPVVAEAWGHAPTTSTIMQMAVGDALAVTLAELNGFTQEDFRRTHPGGVLALVENE